MMQGKLEENGAGKIRNKRGRGETREKEMVHGTEERNGGRQGRQQKQSIGKVNIYTKVASANNEEPAHQDLKLYSTSTHLTTLIPPSLEVASS